MTTSSSAMSTLPAFSPGYGDRRALIAGVSFIEDAATGEMSLDDLCDWFEQYVVTPGIMPRPVTVNEPMAGSVPLYPHGMLETVDEQNVQRLLFTARGRVVNALRGLIAQPSDDRFLTGAIFAGRVRRRRVINTSRWVARPEPTAPLSSIVLSLFAVDVLSNREEYDQHLCVCDACGRVSFQDIPITRRNCAEHPAHSTHFMHGFASHQFANSDREMDE